MKNIILFAVLFTAACGSSVQPEIEKVIYETSSSSSSSSSGGDDAGADVQENPGQVLTLSCALVSPCPIIDGESNAGSSEYPSCVVGVHSFPGESKYKIEATTWVVNQDGTVSATGGRAIGGVLYNAIANGDELTVACSQTCQIGQGIPCVPTATPETVQIFVLQ